MFIRLDPPGPPGNPLTRFVGAVCALALFVAAIMFSVVIVAFLALAALAFWCVWQWKRRALRRTVRERSAGRGGEAPGGDFAGNAPPGAVVIEGEAVRVDEDGQRTGLDD